MLDGLSGLRVLLDVELDLGTVTELDDLRRLVRLDILDDLRNKTANIYDRRREHDTSRQTCEAIRGRHADER